MYLLFTSLSPEGQFEHHNMILDELETALEVLNVFVLEGYQLSHASICDGETRLHLSVDALDGNPIKDSLMSLQQQWKSILT